MPELIPPLKPRRTYGVLSIAVLAIVAVIALAAAWGALVAVERTSRTAVDHALFLSGEDWAEVEVNGLQVFLSGDAPSEAARFAALSAAAHEVDGARVIDQMVLPEAVAIEPPRFSVEMLRNEAGISLIGLIPAEADREALTTRMRAIDPIQPVADFLETAAYPTPQGWENALDFALDVAGMLPRSKISMDAEHVAVEAIAASPDQKREWEQEIRRERPAGMRLTLDIRAPLDVISPYIVRFLYDEQGARFDACTAYTRADRNKIISAGIAAGVKGAVDCTIGLGVPSPDWPDAVARGIMAVHDMGGGSLTFSDADITLIAPAQTPQGIYDRVIGELEADLPEVFSLHGVLTEPETGPVSPAGPPEFIATLGDGGAVQLRGRVASEQDRTIAETLARARFGTRNVYAPLRLDPALPTSWAVRTLAGLEALDQLADGRVVVRPDVVTVAGSTGDKGASAEISRLLSEKLGEAEDFRVNVKYEESLDPVAAMPTPQECVADVNAVMAQSKISFAPGSAEIERASATTVDRIADILKTCPDVAMEIGGYTDSQGREEMNQALSQRRAEAVVSALLARRVLTTNLKAFGYGEAAPIADNDTEDGREANRRIEFSLVGETRPRAEVADGEAPTIRPLARPTLDGADDTGVGAPTVEDAGETKAGTADGEAGEAVSEDGSEGAAEPAPETPDATGESVEDGAAGVGDGAAEPAVPGADAAEPAAPGAEAGTDPEADAPVTAEDTAPGAADEADAADKAAMAGPEEGAATEAAAATEVGIDDAGGDDTASSTSADAGTDVDTLAAETGTEPAGDVAAEAADPATPDAGVADAGAPDLAADPAEIAAAAETAPNLEPATGDAGRADALAPETAPGDVALSDEAEATGSAEDETDTVSDEAATATETADMPTVTETPDATADAEATEEAEVTGEGDATGEDLAGDIVATAEDEATGADEATAGDEATADAETAGDESDTADTTAGDTAAAQPSDIPSTRPRARPPIVVHPDLEGIRPRLRPANLPNAPTTE